MEILPESRPLEASVARCARNPDEINLRAVRAARHALVRTGGENLEILREHVIRAHGEPRLGRYFFLVRGGLRQISKIAIGQKTKLVVIVEDDPASPGNAEVFGQQIARKNVRHGQILDGLAVITSGGCTLSRIGFGEENVKRTNATLDVSMSDDDIVAFQPHCLSSCAEQIFQKGRLESVRWNAEMLKLVRFH